MVLVPNSRPRPASQQTQIVWLIPCAVIDPLSGVASPWQGTGTQRGRRAGGDGADKLSDLDTNRPLSGEKCLPIRAPVSVEATHLSIHQNHDGALG